MMDPGIIANKRESGMHLEVGSGMNLEVESSRFVKNSSADRSEAIVNNKLFTFSATIARYYLQRTRRSTFDLDYIANSFRRGRSTRETEMDTLKLYQKVGIYGASMVDPQVTEDNLQQVRNQSRWLSVRFFVLILVFLGLINFYTLRVNIAVTILEMVNNTAVHGNKPTGGECAVEIVSLNISDNGTFSFLEKDYDGPMKFNWNARDQNLILGALFYGYIVTNLFGGRLAEILGGKWVFGVGIFGTSVLALFTPLAAYHSVGATVAVRVAQGIFEGLSYPAIIIIISRWIPINERSFSLSFVLSGTRLGSVMAYPIAGAISQCLSIGGWPTTFYFFGSLGVVWCVMFFFLFHETPEDHPSISKSELEYISKNMGDEKAHKNPKAPWLAIFTSVPVWVIAVTDFCEGWGVNTIMSDLPTYMSNILHFDTQQSGLLMSLPYLLQVIVSLFSGLLGDYVITKNTISRTNVRKLFTIIGQLLPALCLLGSILVGCDATSNVIFFVLAVGFNGIVSPGYKVAIIDIAPDYCGSILGMTNAVGSLPGFLAPAVVGIFTLHEDSLFNWHKVFWLSLCIYILGAVVYLFGGTAELQPWGVAKGNGLN